MYSVYQHWDPLKVCIVGKSYPPEFYSFITNARAKAVMERIAVETEEDYQKLVTLLESFGVTVLRPTVGKYYRDYLDSAGTIRPPPMTPRDYTMMLGGEFFFNAHSDYLTLLPRLRESWTSWSGASWPTCPTTMEEFNLLSTAIKQEICEIGQINLDNDQTCRLDRLQGIDKVIWGDVVSHINENTAGTYNRVPWYLHNINSAAYTRIGKDIYVGTSIYGEDLSKQVNALTENYQNYRWHAVDTGGHSDGTYCPVKPGLIVSLKDIPTYENTFPGWEVIYLPGQSWSKVHSFLELKEKNKGKWWVPGEELNDDFTNFVESWLSHWVGYVEETVFDVNMLVINEQNVVCNNYNKDVFDAFSRHGITPHIVNFRHRYFWDGGLHCITSDVHRSGKIADYFPLRNS